MKIIQSCIFKQNNYNLVPMVFVKLFNLDLLIDKLENINSKNYYAISNYYHNEL